ncbi:hypothetical protein LCGC14_2812670 [marine sediment metagenome]|uniref:Uncharacterized protein n=1 Tax=marine sediment metagenome TaxID=412755 RepID=A0A0F8Z687_9ZZZZ
MTQRKRKSYSSIWRNGFHAGSHSSFWPGVALGFVIASVLYAIIAIVMAG